MMRVPRPSKWPRILAAILATSAPVHSWSRSASAEQIRRARVIAVSPDRPVLVVDAGEEHGIALNDLVLCVDERSVLAAGEVIHVEPQRCGVRFRAVEGAELLDRQVTLIPTGFLRPADGDPPAPLHRVANVDSILPDGQSAWIDAGTQDGWRCGDAVLVRRQSEILAWGRLTIVTDHVSLLCMDRPPGLLRTPVRGDRVEQLARSGASLVRTRVVAVESAEHGNLVFLAGDADAGLHTDDRMDVFRDGEYVALVELTETSPLLRGRAPASFQRTPPLPGDVVLVRPPADAAGPRTGYLFRFEHDYGLVTLGEQDGMEVGRQLLARTADGNWTSMQIRAVYPDHCGAALTEDSDGPSGTVPLWTEVRTADEPPQPAGESDGRSAAGSLLRPAACDVSALAAWLYIVEPEGDVPYRVGDLVPLDCDARRVGRVIGRVGDRLLAVRVDGVRY